MTTNRQENEKWAFEAKSCWAKNNWIPKGITEIWFCKPKVGQKWKKYAIFLKSKLGQKDKKDKKINIKK